MSTFEVQTTDQAPQGSRAPLERLAQAFGMVPNVAGVIANSPALMGIFVPLFEGVHGGTFTEPEIQTLLDSMHSEITTLTPLSGKKSFMFVSGGFEYQPGWVMSQYASGTFNAPSLTFTDVRQIPAAMASARCVSATCCPSPS